jgi:hypothetical protein
MTLLMEASLTPHQKFTLNFGAITRLSSVDGLKKVQPSSNVQEIRQIQKVQQFLQNGKIG